MATKYIGVRKGSRTVIDGFTKQNNSGNYISWVVVKCDCGEVKTIRQDAFVKNTSSSCTVCRKKSDTEKSSNGYKHPLYKTWWGMIVRCYQTDSFQYKYYGGRGISVCDSWRGDTTTNQYGSIEGFYNFVKDMGERPDGHSIDRINNEGNYEPSNCRWATQAQQIANRRSPSNKKSEKT